MKNALEGIGVPKEGQRCFIDRNIILRSWRGAAQSIGCLSSKHDVPGFYSQCCRNGSSESLVLGGCRQEDPKFKVSLGSTRFPSGVGAGSKTRQQNKKTIPSRSCLKHCRPPLARRRLKVLLLGLAWPCSHRSPVRCVDWIYFYLWVSPP